MYLYNTFYNFIYFSVILCYYFITKLLQNKFFKNIFTHRNLPLLQVNLSMLHDKYKSKEGFILETIGYRISKARRYMNMNQKELALKANIPEGSLSRYENDIREPKAQALVQIADALKVSTDYLLGLTDEMEIQK